MPRTLKYVLPLLLLIAALLTIFYVPSEQATQTALLPKKSKPAPATPRYDTFGIEADAFAVKQGQIKRNETLAQLLTGYGVPYPRVVEMVEAADPVFDVRHIRPGKNYRLYLASDSAQSVRYFVYQPSPTGYVVFDILDSVRVYEGQREVDVVQRKVEGIIDGSLYQTLMDAGASPELAFKLAEMYAWQIDFYRIQEGDHFKVVYEEEQLDGEPIGLGNILAARFNHRGGDYFGFRFEQGDRVDYFDQEGENLRKAFLKAPLRFSRISSRYTKKRFHPILKRNKPHLGTDYAANPGTPVHTVGDGVVIEAGYSRGNGNYVKVRHNTTYTTQYLHFSRIAKGIKPGTRVEQGDVIGYVGSTGLATGPHLCYRFWKNGKQVDPYQEKIPSADPIEPEHVEAFQQVMNQYLPTLQDAADPQVLASL